MKLLIDFANPVAQKKDLYEFRIEFMHGDADGNDFHSIFIKPDDLVNESYAAEVAECLKSIQDCVDKDNKGRGGFQETKELMDEYWMIDNWLKYCIDPHEGMEAEEREEYEVEGGYDLTVRQELMYEVPSQNEWYASYRKLEAWYYNKEGVKYPVKIQF